MDSLAYYSDKIAKLKPELKTKYFVQSIGLFGSVVRQDFSETTSDLDVLVDFSVPVGIEFIQLADYLEKVLNIKVDLVSKNGVKPDYMRIIESEVVYV